MPQFLSVAWGLSVPYEIQDDYDEDDDCIEYGTIQDFESEFLNAQTHNDKWTPGCLWIIIQCGCANGIFH